MYANLLVHVGDDDPVVAHQVLIHVDGEVEIHLDDPDDEGSYAVPMGVITVDPDSAGRIRIVANF